MLGVTKRAVILVDNPTKDMEPDDRQRVAEYLRQLAADDRLVVAATTDEYIIDKSDVVLK
jgi:ABC-type lipoprotein export system ATPase subunit